MRFVAIQFADEQIEQGGHKRQEVRVGEVAGVATFAEGDHKCHRSSCCDEAVGRCPVVRVDVGDKLPSGQCADQREEDEERDFTSQGAADESGHVECAGDGAKHEIVHVEVGNESVGRERRIHGV